MSEADWIDSYYDDDDDICDGFWVMKDGRSIRITDMETSHLKNTINLLRRRGLSHTDTFRQLFQESILRK